MWISAYDLAMRFVGMSEVPGVTANPQVLAMLRLVDPLSIDDSTAWCSAFVEWICWLLRLPRSHSLRARSWLSVGRPIALDDARVGYDVVVLSRESAGPAAGHVGFYAGRDGDLVYLLGGNQSDAVTVAAYARDRIVGVRRLAEPDA